MTDYSGKKYLIMGGTSGIGLQISKDISKNNGTVIIVGNNQKKLDLALHSLPLESIGFACDLREPENIRCLFNNIKKSCVTIDGLVYCAGISPMMSVFENDCNLMKDVFSINCMSFIETVKNLFTNAMVNERISIVAISSIAASQSVNRQSVYAGSKAALEETVRCLAKELLLSHARVNAVALGAVKTNLFNQLKKKNPDIEGKYPLGAIPLEEVSRMVLFLLSDDSNHITGSIIKMDSGHDVWLR